jgi:hypothetical protein
VGRPALEVRPVQQPGRRSSARQAIDLAKRTTDIAAHMEAEVMVYWPAQDGFDYPFQIDHRQRLD